jgi:hypothetical protein
VSVVVDCKPSVYRISKKANEPLITSCKSAVSRDKHIEYQLSSQRIKVRSDIGVATATSRGR